MNSTSLASGLRSTTPIARATWFGNVVAWSCALAVLVFCAFASEALGHEAIAPAPSKPAETVQPEAPNEPEAPKSPSEVVVGIYVNDIQELDFRTHSYAVDFYIWFRWADKALEPDKTVEFMNRYAPHDRVREEMIGEPDPMPDGTVLAGVRMQGRFSTKFGLNDYPFDTQALSVVMEDSLKNVDDFVLVPDRIPVTMNENIVLPGYKLGTPAMTVTEHTYPTDFGDISANAPETYSRMTITIPVRRQLLALSIKTFLPIALIIACAALVFFVRPRYVEGRIGLGITALLTLVALQLTSGSSLPEVEYLMVIDEIYLAAYAFILVVLFRVASTSWLGDDIANEERTAAADRRWVAGLTIGFVIVTALITMTTSPTASFP